METLIEVNKKDENGILIFTFKWELDETNTDKTFKDIYDDVWDFANKKLILSLKDLKYLNSKSIWYIADLFSNVDDNDWKMYISDCDEWVKDVLELVGITTIIPTVNTEKDAIKELS